MTEHTKEFKEWYDAVYIGDGETVRKIPSATDKNYPAYMAGYTLALGAWIESRKKLSESNKKLNKTSRVQKCATALDGLSDDALDGGWNFREMSAYTKKLEVENAELKAALERSTGAQRAAVRAHSTLS